VSLETNDLPASKVMIEAMGYKVILDQHALNFQTELDAIPNVVAKLTNAEQKIYRLDHRRKLEDYFLKLTAA